MFRLFLVPINDKISGYAKQSKSTFELEAPIALSTSMSFKKVNNFTVIILVPHSYKSQKKNHNSSPLHHLLSLSSAGKHSQNMINRSRECRVSIWSYIPFNLVRKLADFS